MHPDRRSSRAGCRTPPPRRLERAIRAGKAYVPTGVTIDGQGRSYVQTEARVLGRMLNADLRRIGF